MPSAARYVIEVAYYFDFKSRPLRQSFPCEQGLPASSPAFRFATSAMPPTPAHKFEIPTLAKNARMGHPHSWWYEGKQKVGDPARGRDSEID
jgi:hypothetical protein